MNTGSWYLPPQPTRVGVDECRELLSSDIPVTETQTDTEMIDFSKTHTETNTEMIFMRKSSYCFQRVLAIAILSVCHTGGSVKNGAS